MEYELNAIEAEVRRYLRCGLKYKNYPESEDWDPAYGAGMATCAKGILILIEEAKTLRDLQEEMT